MLNGAYFTPSGAGAGASYAKASSLSAKPSSVVATLLESTGPRHQTHSSHRSSLATSPWQLPDTRLHLLPPLFLLISFKKILIH